jgi:plastocyanin
MRPPAASPRLDGAAGQPIEPGGERTTIVLDTRTDLRFEAALSAPVAGTLGRGVAVVVTQRLGDWVRIEARGTDGQLLVGWIVLPRKPETRAVGDAAGTGSLAGAVMFTGGPPEMRVPEERRRAEFCRDKAIANDDIVAPHGKLSGVLVRLAPGEVRGIFPPPEEPVVVEQKDCMYLPKVQGARVGQALAIRNGDGTLHNVHAFREGETWFNQAQPRGAEDVRKELPEGNVRLACDVHPWMRAYIVVSEHPFFASTDEAGGFVIAHVPAGRYAVEAWHPVLGTKRTHVEVRAGGRTSLHFTFDAADSAH